MKKLIILMFCVAGLGMAADYKVHIIAGAQEYKAVESMTSFKTHIESIYQVKVTSSNTKDKTKDLPGIEALAEADMLLVYCRRINVTKPHLKIIKGFLEAGKPVIGIRTASHAFQTFLELDKVYFGGSYKGHDKAFETLMSVDDKNKTHPILKDLTVENWKRQDKPYYNASNAKDVINLINGSANNKTHPMAWARVKGNQRIFYTSMGLPDDFKDKRFLKLLTNAMEWASKEKLEKK